MDNYTIVATPDDGGVYISQILASSPLDAFLRWSDKVLEDNILPDLDAQLFQADVAFEAAEAGPVAVEGTENVWCLAVTDMWVHIIQTASAIRHGKAQYAHPDQLLVPNGR